MRIGVVDPKKEPPALKGFEPREDPLVDPLGRKVPSFRRELVGVFLEPLVEAKLRRQDSQADERGRLEAFLSEEVDEGRLGPLLPDDLPVVVIPDGVGGLGEEDRCMGGERDGDQAVGVLEDDAFPRQRVDGRRPGLLGAVGADMVGPQGIEGDQDQVCGCRFPPAAAEPMKRPDSGKEDRGRKAFLVHPVADDYGKKRGDCQNVCKTRGD